LEKKRAALGTDLLPKWRLNLGTYQSRVEARIAAWERDHFASRLWSKDPTLWSPGPVSELTDRLGWLELPEKMPEESKGLMAFAEKAKAEGIGQVALLGMGGSSMAAEIFQATFGNTEGYPQLVVLDSTHPASVRAVETGCDLKRTLFIVSSKSGTTTETLSFFRYFWRRMGQVVKRPGHHFVAITDAGTPLDRLARGRGFRAVFNAPADVGGRYSALTVFGLVPAALIGVDLQSLLDQARKMAEVSAFCVPVAHNPGLTLGATLGELALTGRDKLTLLTSPSLAPLPYWIEQLIAESTGKEGRGIVPIVDEPMGPPALYGADRFFVYLRMAGDENSGVEGRLEALEAAGHPVVRFDLVERAELGQEFFRWEVAVAAAGAVLAIHPFNQPDVELAKELARKAMEREEGSEREAEILSGAQREDIEQALKSWLKSSRPGDYISLQAYLSPTPEVAEALQGIRLTLRDRRRVATTSGYGPRFLHSTGQLHKGGPNTGLFLQLVDDPIEDLKIPETDHSFGALIQAQALGDFQALKQRGRRVLRVHLGRDVAGGLQRLADLLSI